MAKILDWFLNILGVSLILIIVWDCAKSPSGLPEGLLYLLTRRPGLYPQEIKQVINEKDAETEQAIEALSQKDQEIEQILEAERQIIREELLNSDTGCISFAGLPNALCIGPRLDTSQ